MNRRRFLIATAAAGVPARNWAAASKQRLRVAVIGHTGRGNFGHGLDAVWLHLPETELVAVADADSAGLAAAQEKLRVGQGFADYEVMLREIKPDIVAVSPRYIDEHRDMALAAIAAGARGIYVEKTFCRSPAEADEIVTAAARHDVKVAVAHRNRYHPALQAIDRLLDEGAIGRLLEIRGRGKEDARGGPLDMWVCGTHVLNMIDYFGGKPLACAATVLQDGRPVTAADLKEGAEGVGLLGGNQLHAQFETERGIPACFDSVQNAGLQPINFGLQLIGTRGLINLCMDKTPLAHLIPGNPFEPSSEPRAWIPISSAGPGKPEPIPDLAAQVSKHLLSARDLIAAIHENRQPLCNELEGRTTVEMVTGALESHRRSGQRVIFPLAARQNPFTAWR